MDQLRRELTEQRGQLKKKLMLAAREARARFDGEDAVIAEKILALFEGAQSMSDMDMDELRARVMELVLDIVNEERREVIAAREAVRNRDVDMLQRRIDKLKGSLGETEHQLREVTRLKSIDQGISSVYKEVQGLDQGDVQFERKMELMTDLFQANIVLQKPRQA